MFKLFILSLPSSGLAVPYLEHTATVLSADSSEGGDKSALGRSKETITQLKEAFNEANLPLSLNQGIEQNQRLCLHYSLSLSLSPSQQLLSCYSLPLRVETFFEYHHHPRLIMTFAPTHWDYPGESSASAAWRLTQC